MENNFIIRMTYSIDYGKPCNNVFYVKSALNAWGGEMLTKNIDEAERFTKDNSYMYSEGKIITGEYGKGLGSYSYKIEFIELKNI